MGQEPGLGRIHSLKNCGMGGRGRSEEALSQKALQLAQRKVGGQG